MSFAPITYGRSYHAGLDAEAPQAVQEEFLAGKLEIIVATIAFGMGIDKPDVRTVIHTALPGALRPITRRLAEPGAMANPAAPC